MSMRSMTEAEHRFLRALARLTTEQGMPPSLREIGAVLGIESTGHLRAIHAQLALRALVTAPNGAHRSIRILPAGVLIAAGEAICHTTKGGAA